MSNVFCQCDKCERDILVGEIMVSLTMAKDKIIDESCVQPVFVNAVGMWCQACANHVVDKQIKLHKTMFD